MKKKVLVFLTMATAMLFAMTGCSGNVPKDSEVKEDLQTFGNGILEENETVQKVEITNRETNQKEKSDKVLASVQTEKDGVSYEKKMTLYYHKYDKSWELEYVETNAE